MDARTAEEADMAIDDSWSAEHAETRAGIYRFFAALLLNEVTEEFLERAAAQPPVQEGALGAYFASLADADVSSERTELAAEFSALLLNMSPRPVMVYESVYTSPLHMMMQDARDDVVAQYASQGFRVDVGINVPEDHMSFELEFMGLLCAREAARQRSCDAVGLAACRHAEERFLREHLAVWGFAFCDDLETKARSAFYRGIAQSLREFLLFELEDFGIDSASE